MRKDDDPDGDLELDLDRFREFYGTFSDGREGRGAKADQINRELSNHLGPCPSLDQEPGLWMAPKKTMEGWVQRAGQKRPVFRPAKVLRACYNIWLVDLTKEQQFANRFEIHEGAADLLDVGRVFVERLPIASLRPYLLRLEKIGLTPRTKVIRDKKGTPFATASLGFFEASIVIELPTQARAREAHVLVQFLAASEPPTQFGSVIGATVRWRYPDLEWQMIKPHGEQVNSGQLVNAALLEFVAEAEEWLSLSVVVRDTDFHPVVRLDTRSAEPNVDDRKTDGVRAKLIAQVLRRRLDGKGRHVLASGKFRVQ